MAAMAFVIYYIFVMCCVTVLTDTISYTSVIRTSSGPIRGEILTTARKSLKYASFKGIPYAEPPIGDLRFKPPVKKNTWNTTLNATKEGNVCVQYNKKNSSIIGSEDCLFLNVFTPHTNFPDFKENDLKAVIVWIHGGKYANSPLSADYYGPDFFLEDNVIVVSINYRLGPLGFLNLNHENATGNAGLKDQNLALKWVNKNIAKFGGDPESVTLMGHGAGAVAVDLHILSNMSAGLFNQSISMSGSSLCLYWGIQSTEEAKTRAFALGAKLGIVTNSKDKLLRGLYNVSANNIVSIASKSKLIPFRPTIERIFAGRKDERFLSDCTINIYLSGKYNKGPHMMGFTSNEGKIFLDDPTNTFVFVKKALQTLRNAGVMLEVPIFRKYLAFFRSSSKLTIKDMKEFTQTLSDLYFITGIDSKQRLMKRRNNFPIYYYRFSFETASYPEEQSDQVVNYHITGVGHKEELPYLFYMPSTDIPINQTDTNRMINKFVRLLTNFAKIGNPTPFGEEDDLLEITWPNSGRYGRFLEIRNHLSEGLRPTNVGVMINQIYGVGGSRLLNDCRRQEYTNLRSRNRSIT